MYADQLPPDNGSPKDPHGIREAENAADSWIATQYKKGWWIFLPAVSASFFYGDSWLAPDLMIILACLALLLFSKGRIRKFFVEHRNAMSRGLTAGIDWEPLKQLGYVHLLAAGLLWGWILLIVYMAFTYVPEPPGGTSANTNGPSSAVQGVQDEIPTWKNHMH